MPTNSKGAFVTPDFHHQAQRAAHKKGIGYTVSDLLRDNLDDIIADPQILLTLGEVPPSGSKKLHGRIDSDRWAAATAAGATVGMPISHVARLALKRGIDSTKRKQVAR